MDIYLYTCSKFIDFMADSIEWTTPAIDCVTRLVDTAVCTRCETASTREDILRNAKLETTQFINTQRSQFVYNTHAWFLFRMTFSAYILAPSMLPCSIALLTFIFSLTASFSHFFAERSNSFAANFKLNRFPGQINQILTPFNHY